MNEEHTVNEEVVTDEKETVDTQKSENNEKTFTQSELDDIMQQRIEREQKKFQKQLDEIKEEQRLAKLSEQERKEAEEQKRLSDLEKREKAIQYKEDIAETEAVLRERELPTEFADVLLADNAEQTLENIKSFEERFNNSVEEAVRKVYAGSTPKAMKVNGNALTKEKLMAMTYKEQDQFQREHPEQYEKIIKGD